jgi:hypothetical protein
MKERSENFGREKNPTDTYTHTHAPRSREFEDTKRVNRSRKSKERRNKWQKENIDDESG